MDNITQQSYNEEVQAIATEVVSEMMEEHENDREEAEEHASDRLHEVIDDHEWIIYTFYNEQVANLSSNNEAYQDCYCNEDIGNIVTNQGYDAVKPIIAYFAMYQDVSGLLDDAFNDLKEALK